jgi:hypothetical protein
MNGLATAGVVGGAIGLVKGIADQHNAQRHDPYASREIQHYAANGLMGATTASLMAMGGFAGVQALRGKGVKIKGHTIDEIAESIAKSNYVQAVFPGVKPLHQEVSERVAGYANDGTYIKLMKDSLNEIGSATNKDLKEMFAVRFDDDLLSSIGLDAQKAKEIAKLRDSVTKENVDNVISSMQKIVQDDKFTGYINDIVKPQINTGVEGLSGNNVVKGIGTVNYALNVPRAYYGNPDKKIRNARIATTAGAYVGAAIGGRYLSGGTLTSDSYGRRDIAGIPFI